MKRLHTLVYLLFFSSYCFANSPTSLNPTELAPPDLRQINPINSQKLAMPQISPTLSEWGGRMEAMRATIEKQTDEINSLKLRIDAIENKLKENGR